jgi:16S rRNA processing protein RimM
MNKIVLGKYVNTHGLKGEIRIKSNFPYKSKVFVIDNEIIINNVPYIIKSYRVHKGYDMVTLEGINDINMIPFPKNTLVFIDRDKYLVKNEYIDSDLIGFIVYNNKIEREVTDIVYLNDNKKLIKTSSGYIPFELVKNVDLENKKILVEEVEGL